MGVRYSAAAKHELTDAAQDYDRHRSGLGIEFLDDVRRVAKLLDDNPELGSVLSDRCRSIVLTRFPFRLVHELTVTGVRILAIAHQKRRPDYWRHRVEEPRQAYAVLSIAARVLNRGQTRIKLEDNNNESPRITVQPAIYYHARQWTRFPPIQPPNRPDHRF